MRTLMLMALVLCFVSLGANYVENQVFEHTQPDGSKLTLYITGDEYYHRVHDANGFTVMLDQQTGYAVYAEPEGNSIRASAHVVGTVDPATLGIQPNLFKQDPAIEQRWKQQQAWRDAGAKGSPTGTLNNIVGFVRFNDQTNFPTTPSYTTYYNQFMSTSQQSLADYYDEVSTGDLDINSYLYPGSGTGGYPTSLQVDHDRGYYSPYNASTNPDGYTTDAQGQTRLYYLIQELLGMIDPYVPDGLDLDNDDDGIIDGITFIIRGYTDAWGDILWPAHWSYGSDIGTLNGARVNHFVLEFEGGAPPTGVSVLCHEMGHMIGFPDLYHYSHDGFTPVGSWSLMASDNAQHETVYEKLKYGTWLSSIPTITATSTPTVYTLDAIDQNPYDAYKIASNTANQFYVVEYRRDTGRYESGIPASGLIVYRIIDYYPLAGGSDIDGNAGGPPDEIYIYRPGGDIDSEGTVNSANFSSTVGRTKIHTDANPEPWLYTNATTQFDGNLVITDVTASGGTTISFTLRDSPPNIWDGSSSSAWETPANWSLNHIPTSTEDVEIPSLIARYPLLITAQSIRSLIVKDGASLTIGAGTLTISTDFTTYGSLVMNNASGALYVQRDLFFETGATTTISAAADIYVQSDIEFRAGSSVNMASGWVYFYGSGYSYFRVYANATINGFVSDKDSPQVSGVSAVSTATLTINGNAYVYSGSTFNHPYTGTTIVKGGFYAYAGSTCNLASGTLSLQGTTSTSLYLEEPTSVLHNLTIAKSTAANNVTLYYPLVLTGNLAISSGTLNANNKNITLAGNWINGAGITNFTEGTGTVTFNGTGTQTVSTETFNVLALNKASGAMLISTGATVNCASYDWVAGAYTISGGTFTVADLADSGVYGTITLNSGTINYTQDSGQYVDLRCTLTINGGTFNIYGGSSTCWFGYGDPLTITMVSGVLDIKNQPIYINTSYTCNETISGGTIRTTGYFNCTRADFTPTGGTVELYGTADTTVQLASGSTLYNLKINKAVTTREADPEAPQFMTEHDGSQIPITRSNTIMANSNLTITNTFTITSGTFDVNGKTISVYNDLYNYGTLTMLTAGIIDVGDDVRWESGSTDNISAGTMYCGGDFYFFAGSSVNLTGCTVVLDNYYGGYLTNYTNTAQLGSLIIAGTEEDPVTNYNYAYSDPFMINGNLTVNATNTLNLNEAVWTVTGNVYILSTGAIQVGDGGTLTVNGTLDLQGNLVTGPGNCIVHNTLTTYTTGLISIDGGSLLYDPAWDSGGPNVLYLYCGVNMNGGVLEVSDKSLNIPAHATRVFNNAILRVGVGFNATQVNAFQPTGGGLYLINGHNPALEVTNGNWISNLYIQKTSSASGVYPQAPLLITGNVTITGGKLYTNNFTLTVGGNWTNSVGTSAFIPGTGTVTFNKVGDTQDISGLNIFYNVTDAHTGAALRFLGNTGISGTLIVTYIVTFHDAATLNIVNNPTAGAILAFYNAKAYTIASYTGGGDLRCWTSSYLIVSDVTQNGFYGNFTADSGHLELHQDTGNWPDLNGNMTIANNGVVDIYGGSMDTYIAYNGNCVFTLSTGEFNVKDHGIYFYNNGHTCDMVVSGGTIRANGSWTDSWGVFDPTGGTVEMTGSNDSSITTHASSWFRALKINKVATRDNGEPAFQTDHAGNTTPITRTSNLTMGACTVTNGFTLTNANMVYLTGALNCSGTANNTITNGTLRLNGSNWISNGSIALTGTLVIDPGSSLQMANAKTINVNNGGYFLGAGTPTFPAMVTHISGNYGLTVNSGGAIGGLQTIFEYMNASGVYLMPGSSVNTDYPFDYCTFRMGASGGRLLWINNGQSFTVTGAVFPANTWGGAYNVSKTLNSGSVYFAGWTGAFGGPTFEQDTYAHIYWEGFGVPPITDLEIEYIPATNSVQLSWTYPLAATSYKIYRSTDPYGTFSYFGPSTGTTWSQEVPGPKYFYKVTAVMP